MSLLRKIISRTREEGINLGPKPNKRLENLRRQANRYMEEDEEMRLKAYIQARQRREGAASFGKGNIMKGTGKIVKKKNNQQRFLSKTKMI